MNKYACFGVSLGLMLLLSPLLAVERFVDVIVVLDAAAAPGSHASNQAVAAETARNMGFTARYQYGTALFGFAARIPETRLQALQRDPRVAYVDLDRQVALPMPWPSAPGKCTDDPNARGCGNDNGTPAGSLDGQVVPWGVSRIGSDPGSNDGAGVHVYVLDTGIDSNHGDLAANLGKGFAAVACNDSRKICRKSWDDDNGHGTHVGGTIAAVDNNTGVIGVAPGVTLHAVKVLGKSGSGSYAGVIAGIDWVAAQTRDLGAATVANMSMTASGYKSGSCSSDGFSGSDAFHAALCNARNAGVVVAVAAGNSGTDAEYAVPAAYDDTVMAVSATTASNNWPSWSNWGNNSAEWFTQSSAPVAIAAPGVSVLSTQLGGGTSVMSGTSMASPHLAGAIALWLANTPQSADGAAFINARSGLLSTAEDTSAFNNSSGHVHEENFLDARGL